MVQENQKELGIIGSKGCFPQYAKVLTTSGYKNISEIVVGDEVISYNDTGRLATSIVEEVFFHENNEVSKYTYWGGEIYATANHWVLNHLNTFSEIGNLSTHDCLVDLEGTLRPMLSSEEAGIENVYNLSVTPDHTFIVDGIRVHNGGGGKGGGTARAAVEDKNTLRSKQFARVLDLVSEGEIQGLVSGYQSIYYNEVPLQNADGTFNFKDVYIEARYGTQNQPIIQDLIGVEDTRLVNTRVFNGTPLVRRVSNLDADQVYLTMEVPQLTEQDTTNGDLHGSSVAFTIEIKSDANNIASVYNLLPTGFAASTKGTFLGTVIPQITAYPIYREPGNSNSSTLHVIWLSGTSTATHTVNIGIYFRVVGATTWNLYDSQATQGKATVNPGLSWYIGANHLGTPQRYYSNITIPHDFGTFEFKVEFIGTSFGYVGIGG